MLAVLPAFLLVFGCADPPVPESNDGNGVFSERQEEAGLTSDRGSATLTLADVDGDGEELETYYPATSCWSWAGSPR